jgi:hypothetical protein
MTANLEHFRNLYGRVGDAYGLMTARGPIAVREPLTDDHLRAHLEGRERIGAYFLDAEGMTDQLVFDDDANQPELVKRLLSILDEIGIEAYVETSKSKGFHVRAHFEPAPAADLRKIGVYVAHRVGVPDIEVFPKQDKRGGEDKLGNFMWLPLHGGSLKSGKTAIVDGSNGLAPFPDQWEALRVIPINALETLASALAIVEEAGGSSTTTKKREPVPDAIPVGNRRDTLTRVAGANRRLGLGEAEIYPILAEVNRTRCDPKLHDEDVRAIAKSILRYPPEAPIVGKVALTTDTLEAACVITLETLTPLTAADLIAFDMADPISLIYGLLYPETVLVVGGLVKVRKTWLAVLLALCGVSAADFLGHAIGRKLRVLYIGGEGSMRSIRRRLMLAVGYILGLQDGDLENLGIVATLGRVKLDTPSGEEWLQRVSEGYDVVIIDPYYRFLSIGSENDHADQRAIFDVLDRLKAKGKAIVLVHHLRKPQGTDAGAAELRGAGLDGYADSILLLSRKKTGADERFALKYVLRHDEEPDDLELEANGPLLKIAEPLPSKVTLLDLIAAIDAAGGTITGTALLRAAKDATEGSKHEVEKALAQGIKEKVIGWRRKEGKGQGRLYYVMTRPTDGD